MDLDEVADALYGVPPDDFTEARNRRATEARDAGDRALADAIRGLRKPTTSAWLANLLARAQRDELDELLTLGASLREAQAALEGDALRALSRQRRQLVTALARQARGLAADEGHRVSSSVAEQLEQTLEAALADEEAAAAVASGRLVSPLRVTGLGEVDLTGAVAATDAPSSPTRTPAAAGRTTSGTVPKKRGQTAGRARTSSSGRAATGETAAQRAAREKAEAEERRHREDLARAREDAEAAEEAAREAGDARDERHDDLAQAREQRDALTARAEALEDELARVRDEEAAADRRVREAQRALDRADRAARDADGRHRDARTRLDRLEKRTAGAGGR